MDDDVYRYLLEQHRNKQRPSQAQDVSTNQYSYDHKLGDYDYSSELPCELDLYKSFLRDLEFQANLEEFQKQVDRLDELLQKQIEVETPLEEAVHDVSNFNPKDQRLAQIRHEVALDVDVMPVKDKVISSESTKGHFRQLFVLGSMQSSEIFPDIARLVDTRSKTNLRDYTWKNKLGMPQFPTTKYEAKAKSSKIEIEEDPEEDPE
ncbi:hypothetical protein J1N35_013570 [Gossypium stocksii]|uniref:Uncharacterized protein n=1 Tax=Gossypium stocksii TaxID=47602 RepID=A0A9D4A8H5_9ROSI|nr:hypothetical protein J1N35_013570 [Gossypium stocksii]